MTAAGARCPSGTLVVVAGPDARGKEMVVASARRRFGDSRAIDFPVRVMTRPPRECCDYLSVSRRVFRDMQRDGSFALSWHAQGHEAAAPASILDSLRDGRLVVLVAAREVASQARALRARVHVVEVLAGPDAARLFPRALGRPAPRASSLDHRLVHSGDIAEAVRRFNAHLEELIAGGMAAPALSQPLAVSPDGRPARKMGSAWSAEPWRSQMRAEKG